MHTKSSLLIGAVLASAGALLSASAFAGSETIMLVRSSLANDADTAGTWQYEGGAIQNTRGVGIGTYIISRRVTTAGTSTYNTAAETISLFFAPKVSTNAPNVITLEGAHSFNSGNFVGSVSAASNEYHLLIGADASATIPSANTSKLVLNWIGPSINLP